MRVEESIEIDRPVEEVFAHVANPENLPKWPGLAIEVKGEPGGSSSWPNRSSSGRSSAK